MTAPEVNAECTCPDDDCRETCPVCLSLPDNVACVRQTSPEATDAPVSRVQAIEAAEDHADQTAFDAWRERGL